MRTSLLEILRNCVAGALLAAGLGAAVPAWAQSQSCKDQAVVECFDGCLDPLNFQECLVGCAAGGYNNQQFCVDQCFNNPVCESNCKGAIELIGTCAAPSSKLTVIAGVPVFNRSTRTWQQVLRLTNTTQSDVVGNIAVVLEGAANGWNLANATGSSTTLGSGGPYVDLTGLRLQPGASTLVPLVFSRTGTLPFSLTPRPYSSAFR
jgi:hypothetical protein